MVSTVVRAAKDLLHRALAVDGKMIFFLLYGQSLEPVVYPLCVVNGGETTCRIPECSLPYPSIQVLALDHSLTSYLEIFFLRIDLKKSCFAFIFYFF